MMFKGKLIFPYESMNDLDWLMIDSDELPGIEEFMNNTIGRKDPTGEQYYNMMKIYEYFECKNMSDLLHIYTLEDGMPVGADVKHIRMHVWCSWNGSAKFCQYGKVQLRLMQENHEYDHANHSKRECSMQLWK